VREIHVIEIYVLKKENLRERPLERGRERERERARACVCSGIMGSIYNRMKERYT